jgi:hypothetical protein
MSFPKMFYRSDGTTTTVTTQAQQDALSGAWFDSPADYGLITAPSVDDVADTTNTAAATPYAPNALQRDVTPA